MSVETFFVVIDTICLFGMIIGMSVNYFIDKMQDRKIKLKQLQEELKEFEEYKRTKLNNDIYPDYLKNVKLTPINFNENVQGTTEHYDNIINHKINEKPKTNIRNGKTTMQNKFEKIIKEQENINYIQLCKCGHDINDHVLDDKNKKACYHVIRNISEDECEFCDCMNYYPRVK